MSDLSEARRLGRDALASAPTPPWAVGRWEGVHIRDLADLGHYPLRQFVRIGAWFVNPFTGMAEQYVIGIGADTPIRVASDYLWAEYLIRAQRHPHAGWIASGSTLILGTRRYVARLTGADGEHFALDIQRTPREARLFGPEWDARAFLAEVWLAFYRADGSGADPAGQKGR